MTNQNELSAPVAEDSQERVRNQDSANAENARKARERGIAEIGASLEGNPDSATLSRMLKLAAQKSPEERGNLERMSADADVRVLEASAKYSALSPEAAALLEKRKERRRELSRSPSGTGATEAANMVAMPKRGPEGAAPDAAPDYAPGTKILTSAEVRNAEKLGKAALEGKSADARELSPEDRKALEKKVGQANLLLSAAEAYRDYLANLETNIRWKNVSSKPERYQNQIRAVESVLSELASVAAMPEAARADALKKLDVRALADKAFVPETKLSTFGSGLMNQPMAEFDVDSHETRFLPNPVSTLAETEGRYAKMKALVTDGGDFDAASVRRKKYEILSLLRANDSRDDDGMKLNSGDAISKQAEADVLSNAALRKDESVRQAFDAVLAMRSDPKASEAVRSALFGVSVPNARSMEITLQSYGIELPKPVLASLAKRAAEYRSARDSISEKQAAELSKSVERPWTFPAEFVAKFRKDPVWTAKEAFERSAADGMLSRMGKETVRQALLRDVGKVREIGKSDPAVKLYANVEWITHASDETVNGRIDTAQFVLEQCLIMYASWMAGNFVARIPALDRSVSLASNLGKAWAERLAGAGRLSAFAGRSVEIAGTSVTEGVPFAIAYSSLNSLATQGYLGKGAVDTLKSMLDANNLGDNSRIVAFLGVIKVLLPAVSKLPNPQSALEKIVAREFPEFAKKLGTNPTLAKWLGLSRSAIQIGQNVTLDTAALVGADTVIRWLRREDLPANADEIPNYLAREFEAIIPYVVGLRTLTRTLTKGSAEPIEVDFRPNGDVSVKMPGWPLAIIKREFRNLPRVFARTDAGSKENPEAWVQASKKRERVQETRTGSGNADAPAAEPLPREETVPAAEPTAEKDAGGRYEDGAAWIWAPKRYLEATVPDETFSKTSTNHSANNLKPLGIDPKSIRLADAVSWFAPELDTASVWKKFSELLSWMPNVESPELLRKQAETALGAELRAKYGEMMKDYQQLTPDAQRAMDEWRDSMERQASSFAEDFSNALRAKLEWGKMDGKWGDVAYMERITGLFAEKATSQLKSGLTGAHSQNEAEKTAY